MRNPAPACTKLNSDLSAEQVKAMLSYDPETGIFVWSPSCSSRLAGKVAGRPDRRGYLNVFIRGRCYKAHRLAWLVVHRSWPEGHVDHINRATADNRIVNLRVATCSQNQINRGGFRSNSSEVKGVTWHAGIGKWQAQVGHNGKSIYLGCFEKIEDAAAARSAHEARLHGAFARHA